MEVRIKFSADIYIEGETIREVRDKFETMELWSEDAKLCGIESSEVLLVEEADTYNDLRNEYNHAFEGEG